MVFFWLFDYGSRTGKKGLFWHMSFFHFILTKNDGKRIASGRSSSRTATSRSYFSGNDKVFLCGIDAGKIKEWTTRHDYRLLLFLL